MIRCDARVLATIADHARRAAPHECCGLLLGTAARIDEAHPTDNRAADPARRYEIDPRDFFSLVKQCRGTSRAVVGAYHSHPRSAAEPSPTDGDHAFAEFLYLIAGPVRGGAAVPIEAYRFEAGNFRRLRLVPDAEEP